ncbi:transposase [Streptomyces canus]
MRPGVPCHIPKYLWGEHFWSPSYFAATCGGRPARRHQGVHRDQKHPG